MCVSEPNYIYIYICQNQTIYIYIYMSEPNQTDANTTPQPRPLPIKSNAADQYEKGGEKKAISSLCLFIFLLCHLLK